MKIAIIGTGIAGLGAAYLLHRNHEIAVYEQNGYAGGHSRTITLPLAEGPLPVDTGFIVFNKRNYPLLTKLFEELSVPITPSDMSFGASIDHGWLEYGSKGLFSQKANWLRPKYWAMLRDILKFNRSALSLIRDREDLSLGAFLSELGTGEWFKRYYLLAMGAAIWSCPPETMLNFPASSFLRFFENHGLLTVNAQPQWYTVTGGSAAYVDRLTAGFKEKINIGRGALRVTRLETGVRVTDHAGRAEIYDHAILACHADEALKLLESPTADERSILSAFAYQSNTVIVHSDVSFMPRSRGAWASWVYLSETSSNSAAAVSLSYWMNQLQSLKSEKPIIITLNPGRRPAQDLTYDEHEFSHPVFTLDTMAAQKRMKDIQNKSHISFCGAYQRYGFHEDGFMSAVSVARDLGVEWG